MVSLHSCARDATLGYLRSAFSSRNSIQLLRNALPLWGGQVSHKEGGGGMGDGRREHSPLDRLRVPNDRQRAFRPCHCHCIQTHISHVLSLSPSHCNPHLTSKKKGCRTTSKHAKATSCKSHKAERQKDQKRNSPFNRLFSPRNPTSPSALLRTSVTMTASFSRPWNPSTLPSSMPGNSSLRGARIASWGDGCW